MNADEAVQSTEAGFVEKGPEPFTPGWWRGRSSDELRAFINRGIGSGPAFDGATLEAERRARECLREEDEAVVAEVDRKKRLRRVILEACLLALLLLLLATQFTR